MKGLSTTWLDVVAQEFRKDDYGIAALSAEELGDAPIIVDIGANVGFFSIMMAKKFPNATIYALEPVEINFAFLNWNLGRNAITNVVPLNFGVGDKTGLVELQSIHSWNQVSCFSFIISFYSMAEYSINIMVLLNDYFRSLARW